MARESAAVETSFKDLKVKLPSALVIRLHAIKVMRGVGVSDTVREALDRYFADERGA